MYPNNIFKKVLNLKMYMKAEDNIFYTYLILSKVSWFL